jgi:hypothetical protein
MESAKKKTQINGCPSFLQMLDAPGLTPKAVLEKLAAIQMLDVWLPTTDGRTLVMSRYTQPDTDQLLLLKKLGMRLPEQPLPKIYGDKAQVPKPLSA